MLPYQIAFVKDRDLGAATLFLYKEENAFRWFKANTSLPLAAKTISQAVYQARRSFRLSAFRLLDCGKLFTLPERDEHGAFANFFEFSQAMAAPNYTYFDKERGHLCQVKEFSQEAVLVYNKLHA